MKNITAVSLISFKEGLRNRVLYGVVLMALIMMVFAILISGFFMRDISKVMLDFCLATVNIGGLLVPFFWAFTFWPEILRGGPFFPFFLDTFHVATISLASLAAFFFSQPPL